MGNLLQSWVTLKIVKEEMANPAIHDIQQKSKPLSCTKGISNSFLPAQ